MKNKFSNSSRREQIELLKKKILAQLTSGSFNAISKQERSNELALGDEEEQPGTFREFVD